MLTIAIRQTAVRLKDPIVPHHRSCRIFKGVKGAEPDSTYHRCAKRGSLPYRRSNDRGLKDVGLDLKQSGGSGSAADGMNLIYPAAELCEGISVKAHLIRQRIQNAPSNVLLFRHGSQMDKGAGGRRILNGSLRAVQMRKNIDIRNLL